MGGTLKLGGAPTLRLPGGDVEWGGRESEKSYPYKCKIFKN